MFVSLSILVPIRTAILGGSQAGGWRHDLCGPYGVVPNAQCHTGIFPPFPYPDGRRGPVYDKVAGRHNVIVITPEMAEGFYHGAPNIVGRRVSWRS